MHTAGTNGSVAARQTGNPEDHGIKPVASLFTLHHLQHAIERGRRVLLSRQHADGYWVFDLEADCTISAEYLLLQAYLGRPVPAGVREGIARHLRRAQLSSGGWPLFAEGAPDLSASVKAYFALKLAGDDPELSHMAKARAFILAQGGAARTNVFTRITLALFGQVPWRTLPAMPPEIMLLPEWFFFHLHKVSYWSRTVIVPLLILYARRPVRSLPPEKGIAELFLDPPARLDHLDRFAAGSWRKSFFLLLDRGLKRMEPLWPAGLRRKAEERAEAWTRERMRGEGGIGAIFPAMANAVMALKSVGCPDDDPDFQRGLKALDDLLLRRDDEHLCQPCNSPIWDSCLGLNAILESGLEPGHHSAAKAVDWLMAQQHSAPGDWARRNPGLAPGGWAFQFENGFYPDVDDTSMVLTALLRAGLSAPADPRLARAVEWMLGMQSGDGGWGAFDIDNDSLHLNDI
ncbi:MAG: squalene--hopene cyclase, partial [Desulfobacteraceae bacterium]|nr:squalene--hopene cyclase [Desulfobacteraceae bacterium]